MANLTNTSSDYQVALTAANAAKALASGQPLSAVTPYISAILGSSDPNAVSMAKTMLSTIQADIKPTTSTPSTSTSSTSAVNVDSSTTPTTTTPTTTSPTTTSPTTTPVTTAANTPTAKSAPVDPLATPSIQNALAKIAVNQNPTDKIKAFDVNQIFDAINSSNPSEDTTINARGGGSINDLVQLLNSRG